MRCVCCGKVNRFYRYYCGHCHQALDGSGTFERGYGLCGRACASPASQRASWAYLLGAILLWGVAAVVLGRLGGDIHRFRRALWSLPFGVCGVLAFMKYHHGRGLHFRG